MSELTKQTISVKLKVEELRVDHSLSLWGAIAEELGHSDFNVDDLRMVGFLDAGFWRYNLSSNALFDKSERYSFFDLNPEYPMTVTYKNRYGLISVEGDGSIDELLIMADLTIGAPMFDGDVLALTIPTVVEVKDATNITTCDTNSNINYRQWVTCKFAGTGKFTPMYNLDKEIIGFTLVQD